MRNIGWFGSPTRARILENGDQVRRPRSAIQFRGYQVMLCKASRVILSARFVVEKKWHMETSRV